MFHEMVQMQRRIIVPKSMEVLEYTASAGLSSLKPGQKPIIMQKGTSSQVLEKDTVARLSQQLVILPSSDDHTMITLKLPMMENVSAATDIMGVQVSSNRLSSLSYFA